MRYQWFLFDADGTLFDYDRAEATALRLAFEEAGDRFEADYVEAYRQINADIWWEFEQGRITQRMLRTRRFEQLFESIQVEADPVPFSASYLGHLAAQTDLIEGAEEVIRALHGRAHLALITNGLTEVQRPRFAASALSDCFDSLVISEEVGAAKPDRRIFDIAFARMAWPRKEQVLMVGDSLTSDIKGGSNYGIDTCWYNPEGKPGDVDIVIRYQIRDLRELLDLVGAA